AESSRWRWGRRRVREHAPRFERAARAGAFEDRDDLRASGGRGGQGPQVARQPAHRGVEIEGEAVLADRGVRLAAVLEHLAEVEVGHRDLRRRAHGTAQHLARLVPAPPRRERDAELVERPWRLRIQLEHALEERYVVAPDRGLRSA